MKKRAFLDYASITPIDPKVEKAMALVQRKFWANPSSLHEEGELAKNLLEKARTKIAQILHCRSGEIFFTSGGTEALNLAILGTVRAGKKILEKQLPHIIVSRIEHPAVLEPIKFLVENGEAEVSFLSPDEKGLINPESVRREIKENTVLVVIQHANNEIGTIQPVRAISKVLKDSFPYLVVDACQSVLYEDVSLERLGADILVLDGLKMYGPRGAGILAVKRDVKISPIAFGGGQENDLRPGTENVASAVGLAKALEIAAEKRKAESSRLAKLRDYTVTEILKNFPKASFNGSLENRLPNNINVCFPGQDSEFLVIKLDTLGFAVSAASACHALTLENGSYVIENLGKPECASASLRITLGRDTKKTDLDKFISSLKKIIH